MPFNAIGGPVIMPHRVDKATLLHSLALQDGALAALEIKKQKKWLNSFRSSLLFDSIVPGPRRIATTFYTLFKDVNNPINRTATGVLHTCFIKSDKV